ncbi:MAG: SulP family inorganic anion transporter [Cyanobacteriota bacterium]
MPPATKVRWSRQNIRTLVQQELHPSRLVPSLTAGIIAGIFLVVYAVSFGALIFSGELTPFTSAGIGLVLFTAITVSIIVALGSSLPGVLIIPQDGPGVILSLLIGAIVTKLSGSATPAELFATAVMAIATTSLLTGAICFLLGAYRLGNLTRFAPYPVIGGFLSGTGYLIAQSGFSLLSDRFFSLSELDILLQPQFLIRWVPGVVFGLILLWVLRHRNSVFIVPGMVLVGSLIFHAALFLTQTNIAEARELGLLLPEFPKGALWQPLKPDLLLQAHWQSIWEQLPRIVSIVLVTVMMLLLNSTGIELASGRDIDLNQELRAAGLGNIVAGLGGGIIGFHGLGLSTLCSAKIGAKSRVVGILAALVCVLVLFAGGFVSLLPKAVLGGMLIFLGFGFLVEWIYDSWFKLSKSEYALVQIILLAIALVGFLEGVGLGLAIAMVLFVVNYSRTRVAKHVLSGVNYRSRAGRSPTEHRTLRQEGEQLYILDLQGFLFFGTATTLINQIQQRVQAEQSAPLKFVVLNFQAVTGLDSSAILGFEKLKQIAQRESFDLLFTHLSPEIAEQIQRGGLIQEDDPICLIFPDLDRGVEWCENKILESISWRRKKSLPLVLQLESWFPNSPQIAEIGTYLEELDLEAGDTLFCEGETAIALYIIEFGQVTVWAQANQAAPKRLQTLGAGSFVGEMEFFSNTAHQTTAIADAPSTMHQLTRTALTEMQSENPPAAIAFQQAMNQLMAERLSHAYQEINQLLD